MLQKISWIDKANESISIIDVLTDFDVYVPSSIRNGGNKKIYCPFGFYHSDNGLTKAMRVYLNSNSVYCFSCSKRYEPVSLAAAKWDTSWANAAMTLLEASGIKSKSLEERWVEATSQKVESLDLIALADALKTFCSGISSSWQTDQLDDTVSSKLAKCFELLNSVKTEEDALKWLKVTKLVMRKTLE